MTLNGIEYDDVPQSIPKRDYGVYEEGKRTKVRFIWLDRYERDKTGPKLYGAYMLTLTNYGSASIDGKPLRNPEDLKKINELFDRVFSGKKV